ncbi:MAG: hypothetical protein WDO13_10085 [Verrucomicrobiota bacterium]
MKMEDHDWLDQRLASSEKYVADDGFAAKVAERLPQRRARAAVLRGWILFASIFAAVCLGALQIVPLVRDFERLALGKVPADALVYTADLLHNPEALSAVAVAAVVLALAAIPILRRWA